MTRLNDQPDPLLDLVLERVVDVPPELVWAAWTNALAPGYRPANPSAAEVAECGVIVFTAVISIEPHNNGSKYTALAMHREEAGRKKHEEMGFHQGWGTALDQLVAHMKKQ